MKKVISLFLVMAMMLTIFTVSINASFSVSDKDEDGNTLIWSAKDAIAAYEEETGEEVETKRIYFQMPNGNRGDAATADHSVTITDYEPIVDPETGEPVVDPETGETMMQPAGSHDEVVIHEGEKAPTWYNDYNILDGKHYAACYWWGGTADPEHNYSAGWCGYRAEIEDYDQGIYYIDLPEDVTTIIWNNGVNGGMDSSNPIYYLAAQTVDTNSEGAYPDDYDSLPYGSPDPYYFDRCIYIIDPDQVEVNPLTNKQTCGANWYVYYGNGCYGQEFKDGTEDSDYEVTPGWSEDMQDVCLNPDHFVDGVHVGYHEDGPTPTDAPTPTEAPTDPPHVHTPGEAVQENVVPATYKAAGSYDEVVYCTECGEEISRENKVIPKIELASNKLYFDFSTTDWEPGSKIKVGFHIYGGDVNALDWGAKKEIGTATAGADGLWEIDPAAKQGFTFTPGVQYKIIFCRVNGSNWDSAHQTYDLLFTSDCLGHVAYCDGTEYENPVDSSKKTLAAFWDGMDSSVVGPVLQISSIGNVVGTCPEDGKTPESIFTDFVSIVDETTGTTKLDNARTYVVDVGTKTEQQLIDDIGTDLGLTKQQVYDAFTTNGVSTTWDYTVSTLPGDVVPPTEPQPPTEPEPTQPEPTTHTHTPGQPVQENVVPASCTAQGSYDEVVYCVECTAELSREHKTIEMTSHSLRYKPAKAATPTADGYLGHFECKNCGKLFADASGAVEVQWEDIVVHYVAPTEPPHGLLGDIDQSGDVDIIDVTVIQRVDVGIRTADAVMKILGDVDKNGDLEIIDATRIQRWLIGVDDGLNIGEPV